MSSNTITLKASILLPLKLQLGEGIFYHFDTKKLYFVDILAGNIYCFDELNESYLSHWNVSRHSDSFPSTIIPLSNKTLNKYPSLKDYPFLISFKQQLRFWSPIFNILSFITINLPSSSNDEIDQNIRFNDGKCDPNGNLFIGTMHMNDQPNCGKLYQLTNVNHTLKLEVVANDISISNGLTWSNQYRYYIDTPTKTVQVFDIHDHNKQYFTIDLSHHTGCPDGMTIDNFGYLWIAMWDGYKVICIDPSQKTGHSLYEVELHVSRPTNCTFGGPELNILYITTANDGLYENSGSLFKVDLKDYNLPNRGLPSNLLDL